MKNFKELKEREKEGKTNYLFIGDLSSISKIKPFSKLEGEEDKLYQEMTAMVAHWQRMFLPCVTPILGLIALGRARLVLIDSYDSTLLTRVKLLLTKVLHEYMLPESIIPSPPIEIYYAENEAEWHNLFIGITSEYSEYMVINMREKDWYQKYFSWIDKYTQMELDKMKETKGNGEEILQ